MIKLRFMFIFISLIVITALMSLLIMSNRRTVSEPDQLMVRPLDMVAVLPSPPPPPQNMSKVTPSQTLKLDLRFQGEGSSLNLAKAKITLAKPTFDAPKLNNLTPDLNVHSATFDLSGFALNELDQQPHLMNTLHIEFTAKMRASGVNKFKVKLHVVIDKSGRVHLKSIQENPYPELNLSIRKLTKRARFSPPQRHDKNVQAEFIWPLVLKES